MYVVSIEPFFSSVSVYKDSVIIRSVFYSSLCAEVELMWVFSLEKEFAGRLLSEFKLLHLWIEGQTVVLLLFCEVKDAFILHISCPDAALH